MIPLRGRLIAEIIPNSHTRPSGFIILNRKDVSSRGKVLAVGKDSINYNGKPHKAPCKVGDIVHFKKFKPMVHQMDKKRKEGKCTIWFDDLTAVETEIEKAKSFNDLMKMPLEERKKYKERIR